MPPFKGNSKQQTVHEESPAARFSDRGSIPLGSTKKEGTREKGVPVRDYKKTKNILMGTPASAS